MPTRPTQHQLEDLSRTAFESLVKPWNWVFRSKQPDYGIDGEIEIFDASRKATGDLIQVQLKAVERLRGKPSIKLELEWIKYYWSLETPVLLALWVQDSNKFYWTWASQIDSFYAKKGAKSMTVYLDRVWGAGTKGEIEADIDLRKTLRNRRLPEPLKVTLAFPSARADAVHKTELLLGRVPKAVSISGKPPHVICTLEGERLTVLFSGSRGAVFHSMGKATADGVAKRVAIGIVVAAAGFGALDQAVRLWRELPDVTDAIVDDEIARRLLTLHARAGDAVGLRALIKAVVPRLDKTAVTAPLYNLYWTAPDHRKLELEAVLRELQEEDLKSTDATVRSIANYNLARLSDRHPRRSVAHFAAAVRESGLYSDKSYFWKELGSTLFESRRYAAALRCYECAYDRLGHGEQRTLYADALLHTGRYEDALQLCKKIAEDKRDSEESLLDAVHAALKGTVLEHIVEKRGITRQQPQRRASVEALGQIAGGNDADMLARTEKAIAFDATYNLAWFNRAISLRNQENYDEAFIAFLAAAILATNDDEAWANALFLAVDHGKEFIPYIILFVQQYRGADFATFLAGAAERHTDSKQSAAILAIAKLFAEHSPKEEVKRTIRVHRDAGPPTVVKLPKK